MTRIREVLCATYRLNGVSPPSPVEFWWLLLYDRLHASGQWAKQHRWLSFNHGNKWSPPMELVVGHLCWRSALRLFSSTLLGFALVDYQVHHWCHCRGRKCGFSFVTTRPFHKCHFQCQGPFWYFECYNNFHFKLITQPFLAFSCSFSYWCTENSSARVRGKSHMLCIWIVKWLSTVIQT
jgi:hypothetical protein